MPSKIYILALKHECFYVGRTKHLTKQIKNHLRGKQCLWTQFHKPIGLIKIIQCKLPQEQNIWTEYMMRQFTMEQVRGGFYSSVHLNYHHLDRFLGSIKGDKDRCLICEKTGHLAKTCRKPLCLQNFKNLPQKQNQQKYLENSVQKKHKQQKKRKEKSFLRKINLNSFSCFDNNEDEESNSSYENTDGIEPNEEEMHFGGEYCQDDYSDGIELDYQQQNEFQGYYEVDYDSGPQYEQSSIEQHDYNSLVTLFGLKSQLNSGSKFWNHESQHFEKQYHESQSQQQYQIESNDEESAQYDGEPDEYYDEDVESEESEIEQQQNIEMKIRQKYDEDNQNQEDDSRYIRWSECEEYTQTYDLAHNTFDIEEDVDYFSLDNSSFESYPDIEGDYCD